MSEKMPNSFNSDEEMAEWFERADLSAYDLEPVDVIVATNVTLSLETSLTPPVATSGASSTPGSHLRGVKSAV